MFIIATIYYFTKWIEARLIYYRDTYPEVHMKKYHHLLGIGIRQGVASSEARTFRE